MLEALDRGETGFDDDEILFFEELAGRGHVLDRVSSGCVEKQGFSGSARRDGDGDLLERINKDAARELIPLNCQIELTHRCPLKCKHCYLPPGAADKARDLSCEEITNLFDQLVPLGGLFLTLTGGEPFMRKDLLDIVEQARKRRFVVSILTSGFGAKPEHFERLAALGIDGVQVSIYGATAESHDGFTGVKGSFDAALTCLRAMRSLGVSVRAGVTVSKNTLDSIENIKELLDAEGISAALGTHMEPRRDGQQDPLALSIDRAGLIRTYEAFPPVSAPRLAGRDLEDRPCGAGANVFAVDPVGTVYPCLTWQLPVGSIRERDLADIWKDAPLFERLRKIRVKDLLDCPTCKLRQSCNRCTGFAFSDGLEEIDHSDLDCTEAQVLK